MPQESNKLSSVEERERQMELTELGERVFAAETIVRKRQTKSGFEYLVKWKGWSNRHNTWEPAANILDARLIEAFEEKEKTKTPRAPRAVREVKTEVKAPVRRVVAEEANGRRRSLRGVRSEVPIPEFTELATPTPKRRKTTTKSSLLEETAAINDDTEKASKKDFKEDAKTSESKEISIKQHEPKEETKDESNTEVKSKLDDKQSEATNSEKEVKSESTNEAVEEKSKDAKKTSEAKDSEATEVKQENAAVKQSVDENPVSEQPKSETKSESALAEQTTKDEEMDDDEDEGKLEIAEDKKDEPEEETATNGEIIETNGTNGTNGTSEANSKATEESSNEVKLQTNGTEIKNEKVNGNVLEEGKTNGVSSTVEDTNGNAEHGVKRKHSDVTPDPADVSLPAKQIKTTESSEEKNENDDKTVENKTVSNGAAALSTVDA